MAREKSTKFSNQYFDEINDAAISVGITALEGITILDEHFKDIKELLLDPRAPGVSINGICDFRPEIYKIRKKIKTVIARRRKNKISEEECRMELLRLWRIKTRLYQDVANQVDRRASTYYEWNNKGKEGFLDELKNKVNGRD